MHLDDASQPTAIRILNRFYGVFTAFCLLLLLIGVPFVFVRKLVPALALLGLLVLVFWLWRLNRQGHPRQSLLIFAAIMWLIMTGLMFAGLSNNGAAVTLAIALMLSVVVSQRAGLVFGVGYLLAWLVYIVLGWAQLAPPVYFPNPPLTGWIIVAGACWLFLIPIPELIKAMKKGAALQRSVFEATSDALLVVSRNGRIERFNQRFVAMWGIPDPLSVGGNDAAMLDFAKMLVSDPDAFLRRVQEIYARPNETSFDTLHFKDGRVIERYSHPNSLGGQAVGRVWSFRDITSSYRAQDELRSSQAKFQGLFELSPLGMARNDLGGKFYEVNAAFCHMLGYSLEELSGMSYWDITPPQYVAQEKAQLESLGTLGTYGPYEKEYIHRLGHSFPVRLNGMLIRGADGQPFIWSIIEDISEQKAHEQTLTQAIRSAQDASNAKGEFLANMSHEIRTPMNAILGMLKLLGNTALSANQLDYLSKTEGAANSLLGLLNDILDVSKIDSGKMELDLHPFSVDRLLRELAVVLSATVGNKAIDVVYDIDPALPARLVGDSMRLQQALINLGGNAIKFTSRGQVVVALRLASGATQDSNAVQVDFSVEDSGIGIAPQDQAKIFGEFSQAESSTTRRFGGTGLGLAISQRLVELMGGKIDVHSEVGVGSTFSFRLSMPLVPLEAADPSAPRAPVVHQRALLVDDNQRSADAMAGMLRAEGWEVDTAHSGPQALNLLGSLDGTQPTGYDCVVVDWQMPQMDGWELLRQLTPLRPTVSGALPKIIMLSANGRENLAQRTQDEQSQLTGFLVKPVTVSMLQEAALGQPGDREMVRQSRRSSKRQLAGMRILVVEDNAVNQQVAEELLSFEGALVSIAADGRQGVHAVASALQQFDAVLMDVQMPVMDGYAATHAIRKELGLTRLPIIGLTANAMASDREACRQAGMDEHVGKPFDMAHLVSVLIRLTGPSSGVATAELCEPVAPVPESATAPDIDIAAALNRMGGMQNLYVRSASLFQPMLTTLVADLNQPLQQGDVRTAAALLHSMKGNAATLGLTRLARVLQELEHLCKVQSGPAPIRDLMATLEPIVQAAQGALHQASMDLDGATTPQAADGNCSPAIGDAATARHVLRSTLIPLLTASDLAVLDAFDRARHDLAGLPEASLARLEDLLQALKLSEALKLCQDMLTQGEGERSS